METSTFVSIAVMLVIVFIVVMQIYIGLQDARREEEAREIPIPQYRKSYNISSQEMYVKNIGVVNKREAYLMAYWLGITYTHITDVIFMLNAATGPDLEAAWSYAKVVIDEEAEDDDDDDDDDEGMEEDEEDEGYVGYEIDDDALMEMERDEAFYCDDIEDADSAEEEAAAELERDQDEIKMIANEDSRQALDRLRANTK